MTTELTNLATEINREHESAQKAAASAIEHARRAGELLLQAKAQCSHGEWLSWLRENFQASERTAQGYMRLARELPKLDSAKAQRVADLPIRKALELLDAKSDLEKARALEAEMHVIELELRELDRLLNKEDTLEGVVYIYERATELQNQAVEGRLRAMREIGRLQARAATA